VLNAPPISCLCVTNLTISVTSDCLPAYIAMHLPIWGPTARKLGGPRRACAGRMLAAAVPCRVVAFPLQGAGPVV
jgi:hypothetical protein